MSPIPPTVLFKILDCIPEHQDQLAFMLTCKKWCNEIAQVLYHAPQLQASDSFERLMGLLTTPLPALPYSSYIKELSFSASAADNLYMGDLDSALSLCPNLQLFRLENCYHISNILVQSLSHHSRKLEQLELSGCPVSDSFIPVLAKNCTDLHRLDLSFTNVTVISLHSILSQAQNLVSLDICDCGDAELPEMVIKENNNPNLKFLNLQNTPVNDVLLGFIAFSCPNLETLVLDSCPNITDSSLCQILEKCQSLKRLDCSFCDQLTDSSLNCISNLTDCRLESLAFSACDSITPEAAARLCVSCTNLELLILDGCSKIIGSFIQPLATHKDDLECTLERDAIIELSKYSLELKVSSPPSTPDGRNSEHPVNSASSSNQLASSSSNENLAIVPQSPPPTPPRILSKRSSMRMLKSQKSMIDIREPSIAEQARQERQEKIREKRRSRSTYHRFELESVEESARKPFDFHSELPASSKTSINQLQRDPNPVDPAAANWNQMPVAKPPWIPSAGSWLPEAVDRTSLASPVITRHSSPDIIPEKEVDSETPVVLASGRAARKAALAAAAAASNSVDTGELKAEYCEQVLAESSSVDSKAPASNQDEANIEADVKDPEPIPLSSTETLVENTETPVQVKSSEAVERSGTPVEGEPSIESKVESPPQNVDGGVLIASGRRRRPASMMPTKTTTPEPETPPPILEQTTPEPSIQEWVSNSLPPQTKWGETPQVWTNPAQMTSSSSTWSVPQPIQQKFSDPWANPSIKPPPSADPWAAPPPELARPPWINPEAAYPTPPQFQQPSQIRMAVGAGWGTTQAWNSPQTPPVFVYSNPNRGRILLKLKIETKSGGHQTLQVHELDDPAQLAQEFCDFWQMAAFKEPLLRLISVRKTNAMRQRGMMQ